MDAGLRPAGPGDEAALAAIDKLVNPSPWTACQFGPACREGELEWALVVEHGQRIAGFVIYACVLDEACIHNVAVHPASQRTGLGRLLMRAALDAARGRGASRCYLEVRASNHAARSLYGALGFQADGRRKNYYGGAGQPGAGHPGAGQPGAGDFREGPREDAVLLSIQL